MTHLHPTLLFSPHPIPHTKFLASSSEQDTANPAPTPASHAQCICGSLSVLLHTERHSALTYEQVKRLYLQADKSLPLILAT